jgi:hypothetical protein
MGGANLNFEVRLRGDIIILKILKKYHENQREKLILMVFFSNESLIHAPTLFLQCDAFSSAITLLWLIAEQKFLTLVGTYGKSLHFCRRILPFSL